MAKIELKNVSKRFKDTIAIDGVDLTLEENKIYGLLGRNGAGKSTLLNLINQRIFPTDGVIRINNEVLNEGSSSTANFYYMNDMNLMPSDFTVRDMFHATSVFYPEYDMAYAKELSRQFKLDEKKKILKLSTGYNTIAKAINALATRAEVLMLDEPVLGLDANHRKLLYRTILQSYMDKPKTIILSTHIIEEISSLIERVIILKEGKIFVDEEWEALRNQYYRISGQKEWIEAHIENRQVVWKQSLGNLMEVILKKDPQDQPLEDPYLKGNPVDLQDLFVALTEEEENESV